MHIFCKVCVHCIIFGISFLLYNVLHMIYARCSVLYTSSSSHTYEYMQSLIVNLLYYFVSIVDCLVYMYIRITLSLYLCIHTQVHAHICVCVCVYIHSHTCIYVPYQVSVCGSSRLPSKCDMLTDIIQILYTAGHVFI